LPELGRVGLLTRALRRNKHDSEGNSDGDGEVGGERIAFIGSSFASYCGSLYSWISYITALPFSIPRGSPTSVMKLVETVTGNKGISADATRCGVGGGMFMKGDFLGVGGVAAMLGAKALGDVRCRMLQRSRVKLQDRARRYLRIQVGQTRRCLGSTSASWGLSIYQRVSSIATHAAACHQE